MKAIRQIRVWQILFLIAGLGATAIALVRTSIFGTSQQPIAATTIEKFCPEPSTPATDSEKDIYFTSCGGFF